MISQGEIVDGTNKYLIPNYPRFPIAMVRGEGARIWDADGKEYIDFFAGFGGAGVGGHCHPAIVAAIKDQAEKLFCHGNLFTNVPQVELARAITEHGFGGKVFFCHSGAEANETALKLARLAAGSTGVSPVNRYKIISFHNSFHGRTMGALSLTPKVFQKGLEPMLPGNVMVEFGDLEAVRGAVDDETAGIIVEPIQGEGGVNVPPKEFMQALRQLCDEKDILLICDEVWTAPGRPGEWFGYQLHGMTPDVMTLGKALGGGLPVAACVAGPKYQDVLQPGTHGCTMGGNPVCAAAGAAAMKLIADENLTTRAQVKGEEIMQALRAAKVGCVKEVRGAGLMIGIELDRPGTDILMRSMDRGLLINCTKDTVLRLAPPLTTPDDLLHKGLEILIDMLES